MSSLIVKEATPAELENFENLVRKFRDDYIKKPEFYVNKTFADHSALIAEVQTKRNISEVWAAAGSVDTHLSE